MVPKAIILFLLIVVLTNCTESELPPNSIPFNLNHHIYLKGSAAGIEGKYAFDTGADNLYIDKSHYTENNFNQFNTYEADLFGVGTTPKVIDVIEDTIAFNFGNHLYLTPNVPILDLKPMLGDYADGILGMDYFKNATLEINFENEYMKKHNSNDLINFEGYSKIRLTKFEDGLTLPLEIIVNDSISISGEFQLDFGNGGSVDLTSFAAKEYSLNEKIQNKVSNFSEYRGVGGESKNEYYITQGINIGNHNFHDVFISYSRDDSGVMATNDFLGLVGIKIYKRFNIYIDFANDYLYLKPNEYFHDSFKVSRLGFSYVDRVKTSNSWNVIALFSPSNAEKNGLKIDDKILEINGTDVSEISLDLQEKYFDGIKRVKLKVERDEKLLEISFNLEPVITR